MTSKTTKTAPKAAGAKPVKVTVKGITVTVNPDSFDDLRTLELAKQMHEGDLFVIIDLYTLVLGEKQYELIKEKLKNANGITTITAFAEFYSALAKAVAALKN